MKEIREFRHEHWFLSNFYPARVTLDAAWYPTVEHAYQAAKFPIVHEARIKIQQAITPGIAKKMGRMATLDPKWDERKREVMLDLVRQKFATHKELGAKLLSTGDALLVEGNWWGDTYWGTTMSGHGSNHLGLILMRVRDEMRGKS